MEHSQPSLSRHGLDLDQAGNCTAATTIPFDLIFEILSLLPAKSLFRFQSVSKQWFSTIRSKSFVDSFQTRSKTRPRLLLTLYRRDAEKKLIFSAPEHTDDDKSSSSFSVMARYDTTISDADDTFYGSANGFVCFIGARCDPTITIYNPTTRQVVKLPEVKPNGRYMNAGLGYDPVEDQYKVFCVMMFGSEQEHFVCTLSSSQKQEWRRIENPLGDNYDYVYSGQTCIDGALYSGVGLQIRIVRFDVRSEKIEFIKTPEELYLPSLINYKGKLGSVKYLCYSSTEVLMTLWVLEDAGKQEWSRMKFVLPYQWEDVFSPTLSRVVIHGGELMVFDPCLQSSEPFYVWCCDLNKKSIRKVEIRGLTDGHFRRITGEMLCYPGHIENIRFL
ncbi:unnamed protein product [Eruca vesicaria subsp. sativa]|uniref:F-box domain-containing protein n=1 Tax=Eruca vesicaria subsp. sativa TaxID=29727 RepID=A0ABC8J4H0_ERUVS|nr:unnamed protein product [Eruca vesicaria subsp. sativa]